MQPLGPGEAISPRFRLTARLGAGGMGEVWSAWDEELQDRVAIKVIHPKLSARTDILELLRQECRHTRRLVHPNIVRVYDFHRAGPHAFISMELIEGESLAQFKGAAARDVLAKLLPIIEALAYAHALGIVHRDVKASNIILDRSGVPRLLDFGIAAALNPRPGKTELRAGGSPHSMSPQQRLGEQPRPADDIYASGALLFELLTGVPPQDPPASLGENPIQPEGLHRIVLSMLAREPSDRPESMTALAAALAPYAAGDPNLTAPPPLERREETIAPRPFSDSRPPSDASSPAPLPPRRKHLPARFIIPAFVLLLAVILGVFLLLPEYVKERRTRVAAPEAPVTVPRPSEEPGAVGEGKTTHSDEVKPPAPRPPSAAEKQAAEDALGDYLQIQARLEGQAAALWAPDAVAKAAALAAEGDEALRSLSYSLAAERYGGATRMLKDVSAGAEEALATLLIRGEQALDLGDGNKARGAFEVALAIEPQNPRATRGLERARHIAQVHALIESGEAHEAGGRPAFAHVDFATALEMDPDASKAASGLRRVQQQIAEQRFQETMSQGLAALERREYQSALGVFREAGALRPNSPAVSDGVAQASEGIRLARLASLRREAEKLETRERWTDAAARYDSALKIDNSLVFAHKGKQRTIARAKVMAKLEYYLADPDLLGSRRVRERALTFLGQAGAIEPKGPQLQRQVAALKEQVLLATRPIVVDLRSDGATEVVVYRLGSLGRFTSRELSLRPGTYTIVGSRPGYKDVRREITLAAGKRLPPVYVVCEEPI